MLSIERRWKVVLQVVGIIRADGADDDLGAILEGDGFRV